MLKLDTKPNGCQTFICECKPKEECERVDINAEQATEPGIVKEIDENGKVFTHPLKKAVTLNHYTNRLLSFGKVGLQERIVSETTRMSSISHFEEGRS